MSLKPIEDGQTTELQIMNNSHPKLPPRLRLDDLMIDRERRQVFRGKQPLPMPSLSFATLSVLLQHAPEPVSVDALIEQAWNGAVVADETVTQRIKLLRKALGDSGRVPRYIESVRGQGYRLIPPVSSIPTPQPRSRAAVGLTLTATAVLFAVILITFSISAWLPKSQDARPVETVAKAPIADANADDFIRQANTYSSRHQQADNRLAIDLYRQALALEPQNPAAQIGLSQALSQRVTKFDGSTEDIQEAQQLAEALTAAQPENADSWLSLAASQDAQGRVPEAISAYEHALRLDPNNSRSVASLAYLYQISGQLVDALRLNLEAISSAEPLHYLNLQIGHTLMLLGFDPAAEPWLQRTDQLQPDNVFAAETLAHFLLVNQRLNEAEAVIESALERGVERSTLWQQLGLIHHLQDRPQQATAAFLQAQTIAPDDDRSKIWLMTLNAMHGELSASEYQTQTDHLEQRIAGGNVWPENYLLLAGLHAAYGAHDAALETLEQLYLAGFRDHRLLRLWPSFAALHSTPELQNILHRIEQDLAQQRDQILSARWAPRELLFARR